MELPEHRRLQHAALETEAEAQRALLAGDEEAARTGFAQAAELYRRSYEVAPPGANGRLIGMLKASVLAGEGESEAAAMTRRCLPGHDEQPDRAYALALAALIDGRDDEVGELTAVMRTGADAFGRAAEAIDALAARRQDDYTAALAAIVADFEQRPHHITQVPIADTALLLEHFAERRGVAAHPSSPLLPELR